MVAAALRQKLAAEFPAYVWLADNPEIGPLLERAVNENWDITTLQGNLYATSWWKRTSQTARTWQTTVATDPAEARRQREMRRVEVVNEVRRLGGRLNTNEINWVIENSLGQGASREQITSAILQIIRHTRRGISDAGDIRRFTQEVQQLSREYAFRIAPSQQLDMAYRLAGGSMTLDDVQAQMIERAKDKYAKNTGIVRGLERGMTVWDVMQPVLTTVSDELGISADSFDLTAGWGAQLTNWKDSETGEFRMANETEAIQWARSQRQWRDTGNARSLATQAAQAITEKFGARKG